MTKLTNIEKRARENNGARYLPAKTAPWASAATRQLKRDEAARRRLAALAAK